MCCSLDWGLPEAAAACVPVPRKIYLEIKLPLSVYVCPSMDALSLPPRQLAAASMPNTPKPPQCYLCICSAMRLNPFTSNLNLRAHYTPSRNMPYALHSPDDTHTDTHARTDSSPCYPQFTSGLLKRRQLFAPLQWKEPSVDFSLSDLYTTTFRPNGGIFLSPLLLHDFDDRQSTDLVFSQSARILRLYHKDSIN